jgi:DNA-binding GntR family transcriptional regulator
MIRQEMARRAEPRPELSLRFAGRTVPGNRTDGVFVALKEAILTQTLQPGTPLIEAHLAEQFGVSKTPVREALLRLSKEGLVDLENTRGANVHRLTRDEARDIFEMRLHLEPLGLEQSAPFLGERELQALEKHLLDAEKATQRGDFSKLSRLNIAFHRGLYAHAPNQLLVQWLDGLNDRRRLLSLQGWQRENRSQREWREHRAILEAVQAGDVKLARRRLIEHIERFSNLIEKYLEQA